MKPAMCKPAGFTLIEILVALAVFAALAAIAWGALNQIARTRAAIEPAFGTWFVSMSFE